MERFDGHIELDWPGEWLLGVGAYEVDTVLASPTAAHLERLYVGCEFDATFGHAHELPFEPVVELAELPPHVTTVHASAERISIRSHERIETLSLATHAWPLGEVFPALRRLELWITDSPVTSAELAQTLAAHPQLTHCVLRGKGFAGLVAKLGEFEWPQNLALVVDVEMELTTANALATTFGTLGGLSSLEFRSKTPQNRIALLGLEQLPTRDNFARWAVVEAACLGPFDPTLRIWEWETREEGRSTGWIVFLPHRAITGREAELVRDGDIAVYADWLEDQGEHERATGIRRDGVGLHPQTLPEAMAILIGAWQLRRYVEMLQDDEHPLAPDPARAIEPALFEERVRVLLAMMTHDPPATLRENGRVRDDAASFAPDLGEIRSALQLRDEWNDIFLGAETTTGYALMIWGTGA